MGLFVWLMGFYGGLDFGGGGFWVMVLLALERLSVSFLRGGFEG